MSDYQTDDKLALIEKRYERLLQRMGDEHPIGWLISEVRRYRDEESDHVAAKYWREIQRLRQVVEWSAQFYEYLEMDTDEDTKLHTDFIALLREAKTLPIKLRDIPDFRGQS